MPSYMIANNNMSKIPYTPPRAECFYPAVRSSLLTRLSTRDLEAEFGDPLEHDEWGL